MIKIVCRFAVFLILTLTMNLFSQGSIPKVRISIIYTENEADAENVLKQLNDQISFDKLAKKYSLDPNGKNGGDLGFISLENMDDKISIEVEKLNVGEHSGIINSNNNFFIVKKTDERKVPSNFISEQKKINNKINNRPRQGSMVEFLPFLLFVILIVIGVSKLFKKKEFGVKVEPEVIYADFWRRFFAKCVDIIIYGFLAYVNLKYMYKISLQVFVMSTLTTGFTYYFIEIFFIYKWGATPGKMLARIKVVKESFQPVSLKDAFLRAGVDLCFYGVYLFAFFKCIQTFSYNEFANIASPQNAKYLLNNFPEWYKYTKSFDKMWFWSELLFLLFNKEKRGLQDYIAGTVNIVNKRK